MTKKTKTRRPVYKVLFNKKSRTSIMADGEFELVYKKGRTIRAKKWTLGVFCFKRKKDIQPFLSSCHLAYSCDPFIIRVMPIGRGTTKNITISKHTTIGYLSRFYQRGIPYADIPFRIKKAPEGTICYPAVKVID